MTSYPRDLLTAPEHPMPTLGLCGHQDGQDCNKPAEMLCSNPACNQPCCDDHISFAIGAMCLSCAAEVWLGEMRLRGIGVAA